MHKGVQSYTVVCDFEDEENLTGTGNTSSQLLVYPNPTRDFFQVSATDLVEQAVTVRLYNLWGQEVLRQPVDYWPQEGLQVNTTGLPSGTYLLHLEREGEAPIMQEIVILD